MAAMRPTARGSLLKALVLGAALGLSVTASGAGIARVSAPTTAGGPGGGPPLPDPNAVRSVLPSPCGAEAGNPYEAAIYAAEGWQGPEHQRYPGACQRLHFAFGPIQIRPGQNDVIIQPLTYEKPQHDGYIVRFRPNLMRADGSVPYIEELHLHHAVWFAPIDNYGNGPFFATGEEKTIFALPRGYGFPVRATDQWDILYMIHNLQAKSDTVWITYDIDFIAKQVGESQLGLRTAYPMWLDVRPSIYPVFNAERKYARVDPVTHRYICTYPAHQTAVISPWGTTEIAQGTAGNNVGTPLTLPARGEPWGRVAHFTGGTLIAIGGHLHPGGISDDLDLQRNGQRQRIFTSEAHYWSWTNPAAEGGPPTSWDLSMSVTGLPRWGVHLEPGDTLWMNATYDASIQSTYEDMGIVVAWMAPDVATRPTAPSVEPFTAAHDASESCVSGGLSAAVPTLCEKGIVTHGHMEEASHHSGPSGTLPQRTGPRITRVDLSAFSFGAADQGQAATSGIPTVTLGSNLTFVNHDAPAEIWHSITTCSYPCTGVTGIAFPLANGAGSRGDRVQFDSGQLGYGAKIGSDYVGPAKNTDTWTLPVTAANGFSAGETYSFFCRVHPFMRGAFTVVAAGTPSAPSVAPLPSPAQSLLGLLLRPLVLAVPGSAVTGFATPVVVMRVGQLLYFVNGDATVAHTVSGPSFDSGIVGPGQILPVTGTAGLKRGHYAFRCTIHPNMTGTLYVE